MKVISFVRHRTDAPAVRKKIVLQQNLFNFLLTGEKTVHIAGTKISVQPHQFVLLAAGNYLMTEKLAAKGAPYHSILIFFNNAMLADFFDRHASSLGTQKKQAENHPFLLFEKDAFLVNFTRSLDLLVTEKQLPSELQKTKLQELFLYLAMHYPQHMQALRNMSSETTEEDLLIRQVVTSHINSNITVEELAFLCNMSLSSFKRHFARLYGTSPNRWLLEKRMETAALLLRQQNRKASEIYVELGYENLSSFIQSFKQVHGITPKQYQLAR